MRASLYPILLPSIDLDVQAWMSRRKDAGFKVSSGERKRANNYVKGAKAAGFWDMIVVENLCEGNDSIAASMYPLKATVGATVHSAVAFASDALDPGNGWQSDGATNYIATGVVMGVFSSTVGMSYYLRTLQGSNATTRLMMGCNNAAGNAVYWLADNMNSSGVAVAGNRTGWLGGNLTQGAVQAGITGSGLGLIQSSRTASTSLTQYRNGVVVASNASAKTVSSSIVGCNVMAVNQNGAVSGLPVAGTYVSAYGIDLGMSTAQALARSQLIQEHEAALGRAV